MAALDDFEQAAAEAMKRRKVWGRAVDALRIAADEMNRAEAHLEHCRARMSDSLRGSDDG